MTDTLETLIRDLTKKDHPLSKHEVRDRLVAWRDGEVRESAISKYKVWAITEEGDGKVMELLDWNGHEPLDILTSYFAQGVVIRIEPVVGGHKQDDQE